MKNLRKAYYTAIAVERPLMRLCADIMPGYVNRELYGAIRTEAGWRNSNSCYLIGPYSEALKPAAEKHLEERGFPYSDLAVDGVNEEGSVNVALWMQRVDLERTSPEKMEEALAREPGIIVMERVERFEDLPPNMTDPGKCLNMRTPVTARILFDNMTDQGQDGFRYWALPPNVQNFYGGETVPEEVIRAFNDIKRRIIGMRLFEGIRFGDCMI